MPARQRLTVLLSTTALAAGAVVPAAATPGPTPASAAATPGALSTPAATVPAAAAPAPAPVPVPAPPVAERAEPRPEAEHLPDDAEHLTSRLAPAPAESSLSLAGAAQEGAVTLGTRSPVAGDVTVVGLRWQGPGPEAEDAAASMRVRTADGWGPWQSLGAALPAGQERAGSRDWATEGALLLDGDEVQVELTGAVEGASLEVWSTPVTTDDAATSAALPPVAPDGQTVQIGTRAEWGADESWRSVSPLFVDTPNLGVTVHHTAGANGYAPEEVPAILRGIYYYHAISLGWGDIGYNALVDQQGRVWEGRAGGLERNVRGAHALGMNRDWFGISALGNHEVAPVTDEEMTALAAASAWALDANDAWVHDEVEYTNVTLGWTRMLPVLHGHGDVGLTLCPGLHLIQVFDELRQQVAQEQERNRLAVHRVAGTDRFETAAELAREANLHGTDTAYLTRGEETELVDALAAGAVAHRTDSALLLARDGQLPQAADQALTDLGVQEVVVVGDASTLSPAARAALAGRGLTVRDLGDADPYRTAVDLSREAPLAAGSTVYLAGGETLADALSGASAAAAQDSVLLLTEPDSLTPVTLERLLEVEPARVVLLGGPAAVSEDVARTLRAQLPGVAVDRIGGENRYQTSSLLAEDAFGSASSAVVASGHAFSDAMASTQLAGDRQAPTLLTRPECAPATTAGALEDLGVHLVRLAGGPDVLQDGAVNSC